MKLQQLKEPNPPRGVLVILSDLVIAVAPELGDKIYLSRRLRMDNWGQGLGSSVRHRQENKVFGILAE